jgi:Na+/melibiose symporter-like transporter
MKWPRMDNRLLIPFEMLALLATAGLTPWWSTIVVVGVLRFLFFTSVRALSIMTFASWVMVSLYRDFENLHGPSRIFAKLFSLSRFGIALDSALSRALVFALVGLVGFALAILSAATVAALQQLFVNPKPQLEESLR